MKIIFSKSFLTKSSTSNYPMVGIWYSACTLSIPKFLNTFREPFEQEISHSNPLRYDDMLWSTGKSYFSDLLTSSTSSGKNEMSKLHKASYLSDDYGNFISITLDSSLWTRSIHLIFLYAIDYLSYDYGMVDWSNNAQNYIRDIDNVSAVVLNVVSGADSDVMVQSSTNILKLPIDISCSMYSSMNSNADQIDHYQSSLLDRHILGEAGEDQFIESVSGDEYARSQIAGNYAIDLKGAMCISTSGIIRL